MKKMYKKKIKETTLHIVAPAVAPSNSVGSRIHFEPGRKEKKKTRKPTPPTHPFHCRSSHRRP
jgi:hypothetical protein